MITLNILKLLEEQNFGTIDVDLFWEEVSLDTKGDAKDGIWIVSRGTPINRFNVCKQSFDIYSRFRNKLTGASKLESILEFFQANEVCSLPQVPPYSTNQYSNVRIIPTSGVDNAGTDENQKIVRVVSGQIQYERT